MAGIGSLPIFSFMVEISMCGISTGVVIVILFGGEQKVGVYSA